MKEADPHKANDNSKVLNCRNTLNRAIQNGDEKISEDLILELHRILMKEVYGEHGSPG